MNSSLISISLWRFRKPWRGTHKREHVLWRLDQKRCCDINDALMLLRRSDSNHICVVAMFCRLRFFLSRESCLIRLCKAKNRIFSLIHLICKRRHFMSVLSRSYLKCREQFYSRDRKWRFRYSGTFKTKINLI